MPLSQRVEQDLPTRADSFVDALHQLIAHVRAVGNLFNNLAVEDVPMELFTHLARELVAQAAILP